MSTQANLSDSIEKGQHPNFNAGSQALEYSHPPPAPPPQRSFGNPAPLGLTSFGCGFFLASVLTLRAQGVQTPNVVVPVLILYGGITQTLCGWFEMFTGNTFGATIFASYGAFNLTYGALYLPAFGVISAYANPDGTLRSEFNQAIGLYMMAWMMVTILFIIASLRTTGAVLSTLVFTALAFLCFGIQFMAGTDAARVAGGAFGIAASACSWWAAMAGYWTKDTTYPWIRLSPYDMSSR